MSRAINILFQGEGPHMELVEIENDSGQSINVGEWDFSGEFPTLRITVDDLIKE